MPKLRLRPIALAVAVALGNAVMSLPASACFTPSPSCATIASDTITVTNTLDIDPLDTSPTPAIPEGSLRDAVNCANNRPTITKIKFALPNASTDKTITLEDNYPCEAYLAITDNVTIQGQIATDPASTIIRGRNGQLFSSDASLTLEGMTLTKVDTTISNGRAIAITSPDPYDPQTLMLKNTLLTGHNVSNVNGGAISAIDANLVIEDSTISNNSSSFNSNTLDIKGGGGIYISESTGGSSGTLTLSLKNSLLSNNVANEGSGGAILVKYTDITLDNTTISSNSTNGNGASGGGIYAYGNVTLTGSTISNNNTVGSSSSGGGVRSSGTVTLTNSTVKDNKTVGGSSSGGGISAASVDINLSTITGNSTDGGDSLGGGISSDGGIIRQSSITSNHTSGKSSHGGGIGTRSGHFNIYNSTLSNNYTGGTNNAGAKGINSDGGAIKTSSVTLKQSTISGNSVKGGGTSTGGAIYVKGVQTDFGFVESVTEIIQSTITGNFSDSGSTGGVSITTDRNNTVITNSIISGNNIGDLDFISLNGNTINFTSNLIGDPVTAFTPIGTNDGNNLFNTLAKLLPLSSDIGEPTETHTPDTSSPSNPILDAGDTSKSPYPLDQKGEQRVQGGIVDIGSVEADAIVPSAVCVPYL